VTADGAPPFEFTLSTAARADHDEAVLLRPESRDADAGLHRIRVLLQRAELIVQTLDDILAALRQVGLSFEIIVGTTCSKDDSVERIRKYIAEHPGTGSSCAETSSTRVWRRTSSGRRVPRQWPLLQAVLRRQHGAPREHRENLQSAGRRHHHPSYSSVEESTDSAYGCRRRTHGSSNLVSGNQISYYNGLHLRPALQHHAPGTRTRRGLRFPGRYHLHAARARRDVPRSQRARHPIG